MIRGSEQRSVHAAGPVVIFCADLQHSDGAWMYGFRSFLTLLVRSRAELPAGTQIEALLPQEMSFDGVSTDLPSSKLHLFSTDSLHKLARKAGFTLHQKVAGGCNATTCDLRVGSSKRTCATHFGTVVPPLPFNRCPAKGTSRVKQSDCLAAYHQQLWVVLRRRLKSLGTQVTFRVSLPIYARTASPLNGACVVYPGECRTVQSHVRLAATHAELDAYRRSRRQSGGDWSSCEGSEGYAYIRVPLSGLNATRTMADFDSNKWGGGVGEEWIPGITKLNAGAYPGGYSFHRLAADLVEVARGVTLANGTRGLRCLHVNVFFNSKAPDDSSACLRHRSTCRAIDLKAADPLHWEENQADQALRFFREVAPGMPVRLAVPRPWHGNIDLNLLELSLALSSAVLITEAGTHWSDWHVGWRSLTGLPTVVMRWGRDERGRNAVGGLHLHTYGGQAGPPCTTTYRSVCVEGGSSKPSNGSYLSHAQREAVVGTMLAESQLCTNAVHRFDC